MNLGYSAHQTSQSLAVSESENWDKRERWVNGAPHAFNLSFIAGGVSGTEMQFAAAYSKENRSLDGQHFRKIAL